MKKWLLVAALALSAVVSTSALAIDRAVIADKAENVTPLLNGTTAPDVIVKTADGSPVSLRALLMQKPTVLIFYRGGWCPYCSRQLAELKSIEQDLVNEGYQVLAISPESPKKLQSQKLETEFAVTLISDESLDAIRGFGVGYYVPNDTRKLYKDRMDVNLTVDTTDKAVLPAPAIFIIDEAGTVQFSYVNPDYTVRPSAELVLSAAKLVKPKA
ncbi:peroxiredoxin-like family protein [Brumicola nitratireducens]|uniref:thioredoxin-dependent peroxiredoxin n=1 Tax=Glaciecola nitratireducens (strain JCM 12485 / KCTC 12276 / FR1064) TaxID=1085623 RepID=G4QF26_GLANF|nr:peroxiredoxin-like family protein [Glaciecola nitratireducens]AEP28370.1 redoxin [Glaciecola nitratireducens FR1064]